LPLCILAPCRKSGQSRLRVLDDGLRFPRFRVSAFSAKHLLAAKPDITRHLGSLSRTRSGTRRWHAAWQAGGSRPRFPSRVAGYSEASRREDAWAIPRVGYAAGRHPDTPDRKLQGGLVLPGVRKMRPQCATGPAGGLSLHPLFLPHANARPATVLTNLSQRSLTSESLPAQDSSPFLHAVGKGG